MHIKKALVGCCQLKHEILKQIFILNIQLNFQKLYQPILRKFLRMPMKKAVFFNMCSWMWKQIQLLNLLILRVAERIRELNLRKNINNGSIPFNDEVGE